MTLLRSENLTVCYGKTRALDGLTFTLHPGVTGLLGANGAGKSTLIRVLTTLQPPSSGSLCWGEQDAVKNPLLIRQVLGYVPQEVGIYPALTPLEFLEYMAAAKGLPIQASTEQARQLLAELNLEAHARRPISTFSGGMRQRVVIAQALLGDPQLLVLDEPSVGLDPEERARFVALLTRLGESRIILLATHILSDLETCARDVLVLGDGQIVYHGPQQAYLRSDSAKETGARMTMTPAHPLRQEVPAHV